MDGVDTVRHILCLGKAVLIASEDITLGFLCVFKAACRFQIDLKGRSDFGSFNLCFAVIGVFDNSDISLNYLLGYIVGGRVIFHGIKLWLCTDFVNGRVEQVALGRCKLSYRPIVAADIILACKLSVSVRRIGVNEFFALVNAVNRTCKRSVALFRSRFHIGFCHGHIELFEYIDKSTARYLFPFNRCCLGCRNDIADSRIHFLNHIRRISADKDIREFRHTLCVGHGIFVNRQAA